VKSAISKANDTLFLLTVGLLSWLIPGGGHLMLKENRRAFIIFVTIIFTFCIGIYIGSIGIINPVGAKPWYIAQIMNSPMVAVLGYFATKGDYPVFGRPNEIGQIYTSIAGLLNLLCVVNAVYLAHLSKIRNAGD
jgi:hypothetical protein